MKVVFCLVCISSLYGCTTINIPKDDDLVYRKMELENEIRILEKKKEILSFSMDLYRGSLVVMCQSILKDEGN